MKKQIKLTLLGTMLFTGAISLYAEGETQTPPKQATPLAPTSAPKVSAPAVDVKAVTPADVPVAKENIFSKSWTGFKNLATSKPSKVLFGVTSAVLVGLFLYKMYKVYVDEADQVEQPLV
jgi:hypothetical protein